MVPGPSGATSYARPLKSPEKLALSEEKRELSADSGPQSLNQQTTHVFLLNSNPFAKCSIMKEAFLWQKAALIPDILSSPSLARRREQTYGSPRSYRIFSRPLRKSAQLWSAGERRYQSERR